jgi:triacylglycerol lipase
MGYFTAFPLDIYARNPRITFPMEDGFSLETAAAMAWAAQAAYEVPDHDKLVAILHQWRWEMVHIFDDPMDSGWLRSGAKGFVARAGEALIVSIAGTEPNSLRTWLQNFDLPLTPDGVHRGFQDGARVVLAAIRAVMSEQPGPIYLTGHSLGGAMAAITAMMLDDPLAARVGGVYTIGMPRPGNAAYRDAYNARLGTRTFRLVYGNDLVPKVPPSLLKFRHVGTVLTCERDGTFTGQPEIPPDEGASVDESAEAASIAALPFRGNTAPPLPAQAKAAVLAAARLSDPIRDHLTDRYLRALQALP